MKRKYESATVINQYFMYTFFRILKRIPFHMSRIIYKYYNPIMFYLLGIKIGENSNIYNKIYVYRAENSLIFIGDNFTFTSGNSVNPLCRNLRGCIYTSDNAKIIIGDNVGISSSCIWAHKSITIGSNVKIGGDCIIIDTDSHSINYKERRLGNLDKERKIDKEIIIGDDVWIGTRCIILKGVHIGDRSVIGAGSIVTKDIPRDCIAVGNPARVVKKINI